nr:efflux RND transporter periplasmic adaptor subunit [Polymorphobacter sp.]
MPLASKTQTMVDGGTSRVRQWRLLALIVGIALASIIGLRLVAALKPVEPVAPPPEAGVLQVTSDQYAALKVATVSAGGIAEAERASGVIAVDDNHSTPILPPFTGQVIEVMVQPGQRVVKGQGLLKIRAPEFVDNRNTLLSAAAQRQTAHSQLTVAEAAATRAEAVYKTAGGALKDYQSAQNDLLAARAAVRTADAAVVAARNKLAILGQAPVEITRLESAATDDEANPDVTLRAPIGGVVASRSVAVGQYLANGGTALAFVITDPATVWLIAQVPESASAQVHLGDAVTVTTPAFPGRTFAARVDNIGAGLDPATHRLPVRATIRNPDGALKPQMFASFIIRGRPIPGTTAVSVPASAVIHEGDAARVWIAGPGRTLRARNVTLGPASDGMVAVTRGLRPGERVVTAGTIFVNEAGLPG